MPVVHQTFLAHQRWDIAFIAAWWIEVISCFFPLHVEPFTFRILLYFGSADRDKVLVN